jgi:hypothetical protein
MAARLEGLDEAMAKLNAKLGEVEGLTAEAVRDVGLAILGQAVEDAPVDTGDLRRSGSLQWGEDVELVATTATTKAGKEIATYEVTGTAGDLIAKGKGDGGVDVVDGGEIPEGTKPIVTIGFSVPYAAAQHEHDEFNHPRGGRSKYLQTAIQDKADMLPGAIKESAGEALK